MVSPFRSLHPGQVVDAICVSISITAKADTFEKGFPKIVVPIAPSLKCCLPPLPLSGDVFSFRRLTLHRGQLSREDNPQSEVLPVLGLAFTTICTSHPRRFRKCINHSKKYPVVNLQRCRQFPGRILTDGALAVFHLGKVMLRNAGQLGKLLQRN